MSTVEGPYKKGRKPLPPLGPYIPSPHGLRYTNEVLADLAASYLHPDDIHVRALGHAERAACNVSEISYGYIIPYFSSKGNALPFYRVKILNPDTSDGVKYKQPRSASNHIYFPPRFNATLARWVSENPDNKIVVLTEGEKKALCADKLGIPCVALGGVDSWRNRAVVLPKATVLTQQKGNKTIIAKLPANDSIDTETATLATGFSDLVDLIVQHKLTIVIVFDSDKLGTIKSEVQRAATLLAYELRFLGIPSSRIKQVILPDISSPGFSSDSKPDLDYEGKKCGLDDYLTAGYLDDFKIELFRALRDNMAFPKHPNPRGFVNAQLNGARNRKVFQQIASVVLTELDARGMRLRDKATGRPFYYDSATHRLLPAVLYNGRGEYLHESPFGTLLYQEFGLTGNDQKILVWLASQFTGEEPVYEVSPRRIMAPITERDDIDNPTGLAIQVSDSHYVAISPFKDRPISLEINGSKGILFEQDQLEPFDIDILLDKFQEFNEPGAMQSWWTETLKETNIGRDGITEEITLEGHEMRNYAALLFHISPFLQRWRGLQLPIELMVGEAGSGKSSLYVLRQRIITGRPHLRNLPQDIRDWYSSITNAGGMHVIDNVHFADKQLRAKLSDEYCRLVTEPNPTVEMRQLFTTNKQVRLPISCTFALTAIQQPFTNTDIIQRSAQFTACSVDRKPDGDWVEKQIKGKDEYNGREYWMAHMLVFLHKFLRLANAAPERGGWDPNFNTSNRLAHYQQCLTIAAKVVSLPHRSLSATISRIQETVLTEADQTIEGLKEFATWWKTIKRPNTKFQMGDVSNWCTQHEDYMDNIILTDSRRLGRYVVAHIAELARLIDLRTVGKQGNKLVYRFASGHLPQQESVLRPA